jgi:phage gp36-like protein
MYSSIDDIRKALPEETLLQLVDDTGSGAIDIEKVEEAISSADAEIDGLIGSRYKTPLDPVPALIRKYSVDIAIYNLYSRVVETIPETRTDRYKTAVRGLERIQEGKAKLDQFENEAPPEPAGGGSRFRVSSRDRYFTDDKLKGF